MKKFLIIIFCVLYVITIKAYDFESNGFYYNILSLSDLTVEVTCNGEENDYNNKTASYSGDITIPQTTDYANKTFRVVRINPFAFINCSIGTLTIPENIESIGEITGMYGTGMSGMYGKFENLIIEDSDKPIGCFRELVKKSSDSDVTNSVYLGRDIQGVQQSLVVENNYPGGSYESITFGPKLSSIPDCCCEGCENLTEITLPKNIKRIELYAFEGCKQLTKVKGEGVSEIEYNAFYSCSKLVSFDFPKLREVDYGAFAYCDSLKDVVLPSGVVAIYGNDYDGAFYGCTSLENIVIPSTTVKMGKAYDYDNVGISKIFVGCSSLKTISIANPIPMEISENNFDMTSFLTATLKVPVGAREAYSKAPVWNNFSNIEEDSSLIGDVYTIYYVNNDNFSDEGTIELDLEDALSPHESIYKKYRFAKNGSSITITIKPAEDYGIQSLLINGDDVTSKIESNKYTFNISEPMYFPRKS